MALTTDILGSYRNPGAVLLRHIGGGVREDRALVTVMVACALIFVAQWPRLSREAFITGQEFDVLFGGALLGWVFIMPLALYAIAALSHIVARMLGGQGSWFGARMALFWALLAASPLWLLWGLVAGFIGEGAALDLTGLVALLAFLGIWGVGFWTIEWRTEPTG
ncbi:YIP1 family protein [Oceaniglobus trochenteri]|uniref:YIP1 family protein n=1 Tax=Oceaniglobus trochenteri TaxID=2763260 RepID=UPI001D000BEF|nr:YIP1 family protein [Oceaniglobus trochenteri]